MSSLSGQCQGLVDAKGNFPCLPQFPSRIEAISVKNPSFPPMCVSLRGNPRSQLGLGFQMLPTQDWLSWELNKWAFLYLRGDFFFFFLPCVNKRSVDHLVINFTLLTSYVWERSRPIYIFWCIWVHFCGYHSEEAYKSWLVQWWSTLPMEFGEPHSSGGEGVGSARALSYRRIEFCSWKGTSIE